MLSLGEKWLGTYAESLKLQSSAQSFHRKLSLAEPLLPKTAPKFHLWLMSYFLNEFEAANESETSGDWAIWAKNILLSMERHLENEGVVIAVEPALRLQSRKLLKLRAALIQEAQKQKATWFKVLLPCLGSQGCGALADPEDWCHEVVSWWRPQYLRKLDELTHLDHKSLAFSYLVLAKSERNVSEILPALSKRPGGSLIGAPENTYRLVSPAHGVGQGKGRETEFFLCGQQGKFKARLRKVHPKDSPVDRGDILLDAELDLAQNPSALKRFTPPLTPQD